jgi:2-hydroxymuconate-semialdehyde hydrolase
VSAWANWRLVLPVLARRFHVVAPDQLGFGRTEAPADGRYGREAWTRHALDLVDRLGIERLHVVGNSMGGAIALSMAAERPGLVDRIVLMGTTGVDFALTPGLDAVWGYTPDRDAMRRLIEIFAFDDDAVVTDELVDLRYRTSLEPRTRANYERMFPAPRQRWVDDLALDEAALRRLTQPALLVHGYEDEVIPFAQSSLRALELLPNAELHAFRNCGHWVQIEQAERFMQVVVAFLEAGSRSE